MKTALVIMAAGIGSRFGGGIKQLAAVGPSGEIIMDYSIHDAIEAGFDKIVFIIRRDIEQAFKEAIGDRIEAVCRELGVETAYAFQALEDVPAGRTAGLKERAEAIGLERLAETCGAGAPTLADILRELLKPGRDPRDELPPPILRTDVMELKDLKPGMELQGTVRNVIDFGAFVDIGVHQDGLVHISRLPRRVKHPSELLSVGDVVTVWVVDVDEKRGRIGLTMQSPGESGAAAG